LDSEFASAEAEAAAFTAEPTRMSRRSRSIADDALAARLAGLVAEEPATASEVGLDPRRGDRSRERREHRRLQAQPRTREGVRSVGVSSGPDGEFVFAVTHDPGSTSAMASRRFRASRPSHERGSGELTVAARDPESEG
jgi:hypothetical protein